MTREMFHRETEIIRKRLDDRLFKFPDVLVKSQIKNKINELYDDKNRANHSDKNKSPN